MKHAKKKNEMLLCLLACVGVLIPTLIQDKNAKKKKYVNEGGKKKMKRVKEDKNAKKERKKNWTEENC